ncbi:P-loop containing nucleoside triphosphate hydrolase protein [Lyophyllum atratum]|nr:P-loop containing nucleoside triphosphate hydrolase protein [Lyophyllum atratum]
MGPSGAGKSTFVNILMGKTVASVGKDLEAHTKDVQHFTFTRPQILDGRIVLIDTPGFDGTDGDDWKVSKQISDWLARSYKDNMKLAGVIYLLQIDQNRMDRTRRQNLDIFKEMCGKDAAARIVLTTTMWSKVSKEDGMKRETQMREKFWKDMVSRGSSLKRLDSDEQLDRRQSSQSSASDERLDRWHSSALAIVDFILAKDIDLPPMHITREMVDEGKAFKDTAAAGLYSSQDRRGFRSVFKWFSELFGDKL